MIVGLPNRLWHRRALWPLDPSLTTAAAIGIDALGLNPRELELNYRFCLLLVQRFPNVIPLGSTAGSQVLSLRIDSIGSSSSGVSPSEARFALIDYVRIERPLALSSSSPSTGSHISYLQYSPPASPSRARCQPRAHRVHRRIQLHQYSRLSRRVRSLRLVNRCRRRLRLRFPLHCRRLILRLKL